MSFEFSPFEDDDFGLTVDDLDLDGFVNVDAADLAPFSDWSRPGWRQRQWWHPTEMEAEHLDMPAFNRSVDRMEHTLRQMAKPITGGDDDAKMLADTDGELVSLNDLLDRLHEVEHDRLTLWMDRPR